MIIADTVPFSRKLNRVLHKFENKKAAKMVTRDKSRPVYHIHIRKTAGTSINFSFIWKDNLEKTTQNYEKLAQNKYNRTIINKQVVVGWNVKLINEGNYHYAFSHTPLHKLSLPKDVFKITCLRDPVRRVISHYNMLIYYRANNIQHACMQHDGLWLGKTFTDFLNKIPKEHLQNQIYMFSEKFDLNEALENILQCEQILFTEQLNNDIKTLENKLKRELPLSNQKKYGHSSTIGDEEKNRLRDLLEPEYTFIESIKKHL